MKIFIQFLISSWLLLTTICGCQNSIDKFNKSDNNIENRYPFHSFYIFKQNMTSSECIGLLKAHNIKFKILTKEIDSITKPDYGLDVVWDIINNIANNPNFLIIEGFDLPIVNHTLNKFQLAFYNDTLFYFVYQSHINNAGNILNFSLKDTDKINSNTEDYFDTHSIFDTSLIETLSRGFESKYGEPSRHAGYVNSLLKMQEITFNLKSNPLAALDPIDTGQFYQSANYSGDQYFNYSGFEVWTNVDTSMEMILYSFCKKIIPSNNQNQFVELLSDIVINFNPDISSMLKKEVLKQFDINQKKENEIEKEKIDSATNSLQKQIDSL